MPRFFWTHGKDAELARRYVDGQSVEDIGLALGVTHSTVKARLSTLGVRRRVMQNDADRHGNAALVLGQALRTAIPVTAEAFAEDLVTAIDAVGKA